MYWCCNSPEAIVAGAAYWLQLLGRVVVLAGVVVSGSVGRCKVYCVSTLGQLQWSHNKLYGGQSVFLTLGGAFLPWPRLLQ